MLGTTDGTTPCTSTACWCTAGPASQGAAAASIGWCPTGVPLAGTMQSLVTLDLSDNQLAGERAATLQRLEGSSHWAVARTGSWAGRARKTFLPYNGLDTRLQPLLRGRSL